MTHVGKALNSGTSDGFSIRSAPAEGDRTIEGALPGGLSTLAVKNFGQDMSIGAGFKRRMQWFIGITLMCGSPLAISQSGEGHMACFAVTAAS